MTEAEDLLKSFKGAFEAGDDPNPRRYLEQVEGADRLKLELLIDRYLNEEAPVRPLDEQALTAERASSEGQFMAELVSQPGPSDLLMARRLQNMSLPELTSRLLAEAGLSDPTEDEKSKAEAYLERLERGEMPRISDRVVEALKRVLGVDAEPIFALISPGTSFRTGISGDQASESDIELGEAILAGFSTPSHAERDRVDELFFERGAAR